MVNDASPARAASSRDGGPGTVPEAKQIGGHRCESGGQESHSLRRWWVEKRADIAADGLIAVVVGGAVGVLLFLGAAHLDDGRAERQEILANISFVRSAAMAPDVKLRPFAGLNLEGAQFWGLPLGCPDGVVYDNPNDDPLETWQYSQGCANFSRANLNAADLRSADLHGADLTEATLERVDLSFADLRWSNLASADLRDATLDGAKLSSPYDPDDVRPQTNLSEADLTEASLADLEAEQVILVSAKMLNADLIGADLRGADLRGADLRGADLRADLRGADLRGADLRGAHMSGGDLGTDFDALLDDVTLASTGRRRDPTACWDGSTEWPSGWPTVGITPDCADSSNSSPAFPWSQNVYLWPRDPLPLRGPYPAQGGDR